MHAQGIYSKQWMQLQVFQLIYRGSAILRWPPAIVPELYLFLRMQSKKSPAAASVSFQIINYGGAITAKQQQETDQGN